ncbi:MAG TPA: pentapeptide repeat-containing protein, partial [Stellaceae bacterium]|nr:pentapeptide repeat-containing protein [Stellaceae bacterium]
MTGPSDNGAPPWAKRRLTLKELRQVLLLHKRYVEGRWRGQPASLAHVDLAGIDLRNEDLSGIDLTGANLQGSKLDGANFANANLFLA